MLIHGAFANRRKDRQRDREREKETSISRLTAFATRTAWPVCYRNGIVPILLSDLPSRRSRSTTYACPFVPRSCQYVYTHLSHHPPWTLPFSFSRLRLSRPLSPTIPVPSLSSRLYSLLRNNCHIAYSGTRRLTVSSFLPSLSLSLSLSSFFRYFVQFPSVHLELSSDHLVRSFVRSFVRSLSILNRSDRCATVV